MIKSPYLAALRPRQWTKNMVVFAAPLFAFQINQQSILESFLAFIVFSCISSSFYLFNDIVDIKSDRSHPIKCKRPIAAGLVSIPVALFMAVALLVNAIIIGWLKAPVLGATLVAYAILQVAYNLKLKHKPIVDIIVIATGFVLRACAGAAATGIFVSVWLLLCTAMLALFLAVEKRKAELRLLAIKGGKTRAVLKHYSLPLLTRMEGVVTTGCVMSYALWSAGPKLNGASTPWMLLTFPFVLYGVFRYQLLSDSQNINSGKEPNISRKELTERPEEIFLSDRTMLLTVVSWALTVFTILWLNNQGFID